MMHRTALIVFVVVLLGIAGFAFFIPHTNKDDERALTTDGEVSPVPVVVLTDSFKKGIHMFTGSIDAPTPCTEIEVYGEVASTAPERITISIAMPPDTGICLQQITTLPFKVTLPASAETPVAVFVNGSIASTTLKKI